MAATKTSATMTASSTLTAGTPITSSATNITAQDFATVIAQITNGATGPTLPAVLTIQCSTDNTTFYNAYVFTAGTTASTVYSFIQDIPPGVQYVKLNWSGNTVQNCTVQGQISYGIF